MSETKELILKIQPKVIDHLGIKMYQKPVDVISEFIANAWDADAENVNVEIHSDKILIKDDGNGMNFEECQRNFLTVGRDRRLSTGKETSEEKKRPVLGRKGIGKFAGFGIAKKIIVTTISKNEGEFTKFEMDIAEILRYDEEGNDNKKINVVEFIESVDPDDHSTHIELGGVNCSKINVPELLNELSRRFLLPQMYSDFKIFVNDISIPENFGDNLEFLFPKDLLENEKNGITINELGWAEETFEGNKIQWRIGFYEEPIETEELRGLAVYAKGKMAQKPFFFDLTGGISGQHGIEYMTGQIKMDFIDEGDIDLIATERQRINLQTELGIKIKKWGIDHIKHWCSIWKSRRSEKRLEELESKLLGFSSRLQALPKSEQKTVKTVLMKIANFERLGKGRFQEWCNDILTSWERGRLKELITQISTEENIDESRFLEMLSEANVITALNIAESVKTKILAIGELKERVARKQLENAVRDYIYTHPWIIHPKWESFKKERSVDNLIKDCGVKHLNDEAFNGRVDLILSAGNQLLLLEFMRPGLEIDLSHMDRANYYVTDIRNHLSKETAIKYKLEAAYIVADNKKDYELVHSRIKQLEDIDIYVLTWESLISQALKQWQDYLDLLKERNDDIRIKSL